MYIFSIYSIVLPQRLDGLSHQGAHYLTLPSTQASETPKKNAVYIYYIQGIMM